MSIKVYTYQYEYESKGQMASTIYCDNIETPVGYNSGTKFDVIGEKKFYSPLPLATVQAAIVVLHKLNEKKSSPDPLLRLSASTLSEPESLWYDLDLTVADCPRLIRHTVTMDVSNHKAIHETRPLALESVVVEAPPRPERAPSATDAGLGPK